MAIFTYVVKSDFGFAPNPFWGTMTLNCCKPKIRKVAEIGDWIVGIGSTAVKSSHGSKNYKGFLVYAMKVEEVITMQAYDERCKSDELLINKLPTNKSWIHMLGDCIYDFSKDSKNPEILPSLHNEDHVKKDLSGKNTLLSKNFYYFGNCKSVGNQIKIQKLLHQFIGFKTIYEENIISEFEDWIIQFKNHTNFKSNEDIPWPQLRDYVEGNFNITGSEVCD